MSSYKGILFQMGTGSVRNSTEWGCYVSESPYIPCAKKAKNITSQSWYDEHGDDEYIPTTLYYESVEATLKFVYKGKVTDAKNSIKAFINYLEGGYFKFYDEFYKIGRQQVRLIGFSDEAELKYVSKASDECVATFSIEVKINDPVTDITLAV